MKKSIVLMTLATGLLSGAMVYANNNDSQSAKDSSQSNSQSDQSSSSAQQNSVQSEASGAENEQGTKVSFNDLPDAVQKTMRADAGTAKLEHIRKMTVNGQTCYQASFDKTDMKGKLTVAEDGSLLQYQEAEDLGVVAVVPKISESGMQMSDLPDAVQKTIKEQAGADQAGNFSKTSKNGKTIYHAGFNDAGTHTDLFVDQDGKLIGKSQETALYVAPLEQVEKAELSSLPEPVQKTIHEKAGSAQIAEIDKGKWNGQPAYKVTVDKNGTMMPLVISQNGDILGQNISEAAGAENKKSNDQDKDKDQQHDQKSQDNSQDQK